MRPRGILYDGPSMLDGERIVAIATDRTKNLKTGDMIQIWILRASTNPVRAAHAGLDASVCGTCPLRPSASGACYVRLGDAPLSVYRAWRRGLYRRIVPNVLAGQDVRIGAYGDPAALPVGLVKELHAYGRTVTGYTHAWRHAPQLRGLVMASADSERHASEARMAGWGVFQVAARPPTGGEHCAAEREPGTTCAACGRCDGRQAHVWIAPHGATKKRHPALKVIQPGATA